MDSFLIEADILPLRHRADALTAISLEKSMRLPATNQRRASATKSVPTRTGKSSWRKHAQNLVAETELAMYPREELVVLPPTQPLAPISSSTASVLMNQPSGKQQQRLPFDRSPCPMKKSGLTVQLKTVPSMEAVEFSSRPVILNLTTVYPRAGIAPATGPSL